MTQINTKITNIESLVNQQAVARHDEPSCFMLRERAERAETDGTVPVVTFFIERVSPKWFKTKEEAIADIKQSINNKCQSSSCFQEASNDIARSTKRGGGCLIGNVVVYKGVSDMDAGIVLCRWIRPDRKPVFGVAYSPSWENYYRILEESE